MLKRVIPVGTKVTLQKGEQAFITQSLGGQLYGRGQRKYVPASRAKSRGASIQPAEKPVAPAGQKPRSNSTMEIWNQLRGCYDPEIPVNIVDLGLVL